MNMQMSFHLHSTKKIWHANQKHLIQFLALNQLSYLDLLPGKLDLPKATTGTHGTGCHRPDSPSQYPLSKQTRENEKHLLIIIIITEMMVLSSWQSHCESSPSSFDECRLSAGWPPTLRPSQSTWTVSPPEMAATIRIHYRYLLLLSPKVDIHFTVTQRVEG